MKVEKATNKRLNSHIKDIYEKLDMSSPYFSLELQEYVNILLISQDMKNRIIIYFENKGLL